MAKFTILFRYMQNINNVEFWNIKTGGTYSKTWAIKR